MLCDRWTKDLESGGSYKSCICENGLWRYGKVRFGFRISGRVECWSYHGHKTQFLGLVGYLVLEGPLILLNIDRSSSPARNRIFESLPKPLVPSSWLMLEQHLQVHASWIAAAEGKRSSILLQKRVWNWVSSIKYRKSSVDLLFGNHPSECYIPAQRKCL